MTINKRCDKRTIPQVLKEEQIYKLTGFKLKLRFINKDDKNAYFEVIKQNGKKRENGFFLPLNLLYKLKEFGK